MTAASPPPSVRNLGWRAVEVVEVRRETERARTLELRVPDWPGHDPGQHVDVRLTAEDGYRAERSYSIASSPEATLLSLTVERIGDGEVSPYLVDEVRVGDTLEVRGPIGGHFRWRASEGGPLLLVAGGSGIVPLMAMLRHRAAVGSDVAARLVYSARTVDDVFFLGELEAMGHAAEPVDVAITLTRSAPAGWNGATRRIDGALLDHPTTAPSTHPHVYVCGPTPFVERAADLLVGIGHDPAAIRTERFGPTG